MRITEIIQRVLPQSLRPSVAVSGFSALLLGVILCLATSYQFGIRYAPVASADTLRPATAAVGTAVSKAVSTTASQTSRATIVSNDVQETCVPFAGPANPTEIALTEDSTGLIQQIDQPVAYQIFGKTNADLLAQVRQCAPKEAGQSSATFAGQTNYQLSWRYQYVSSGTTCRVSNASVSIHINQTMPAWRATSSANQKLVTEWNDFARALKTHEDGHVSLDLQYAQTLLQDIQNFPPTPCSQIQESVRHLADSDINALAQANDNYDSRTNHGATQGAILP